MRERMFNETCNSTSNVNFILFESNNSLRGKVMNTNSQFYWITFSKLLTFSARHPSAFSTTGEIKKARIFNSAFEWIDTSRPILRFLQFGAAKNIDVTFNEYPVNNR